MMQVLLILIFLVSCQQRQNAVVAAADAGAGVSLRLQKVSGEQRGDDILLRCELELENETAQDLIVHSNFFSAFDGLELVITNLDGKVLTQKEYTIHQSLYSAEARKFTLKRGKTTATLVFPVRGLPQDARSLKVRLVGTLPGSSFNRILSTETLKLEVKNRSRP